MDVSAPFLTYIDFNRDHNLSDSLQATRQLFERQAIIEEWIAGDGHVDIVLDCLEEQGIGADSFTAQVCEQVQLAIDGRLYVENKSGLLLPKY